MLEPVQGEGGVNIASLQYYKQVRRLCRQNDLLLIFDEVQTGMGRCGTMFCFQKLGVKPDLFTLAKGLGAGFPISALVIKNKIANTFAPGMHASTFGGSPLACRVGLEVFNILEQGVLKGVLKREGIIKDFLKHLQEKFSFIKEVRGMGLMWGVELDKECSQIVNACLEENLIINCTQKYVLRIMPALNIPINVLKKGLGILESVLSNF
jgi:acetylornithine/succinyldiaminopimelate/putrescine aminotransferase